MILSLTKMLYTLFLKTLNKLVKSCILFDHFDTNLNMPAAQGRLVLACFTNQLLIDLPRLLWTDLLSVHSSLLEQPVVGNLGRDGEVDRVGRAVGEVDDSETSGKCRSKCPDLI